MIGFFKPSEKNTTRLLSYLHQRFWRVELAVFLLAAMMMLWHIRMSFLENYMAWEKNPRMAAPAAVEAATLQWEEVSPDCAVLRNELAADDMSLRIDGKRYHYIHNNGNELPVAHYAGHLLANGCFQKDGLLRIVQKTAGHQWGEIDANGNVVVAPQFSEIHGFGQDGFADVKRGRHTGRIDRKGKIAIPVEFDSIGAFDQNGFAIVERDLLYGCIGKNGKEIIPVSFGCLGNLKNGLMRACRNGKVGYINRQGQTAIPFIYKEGKDFSQGMAWVRKAGQQEWLHINLHGEEAISPEQLAGLEFNARGLALVEIYDLLQGQLFAYVNKSGNVVSPHHYWQFDEANRFGLHRVSAYMSNVADFKWGWVDDMAQEVIPLRFSEAGGFSANGLAAVSLDGRWSYINRHGRLLFPPRFVQARDFSHGLAAVAIETKSGDHRWGYIDQTGKLRIPPRFDSAEDFTSKHTARVEYFGKVFLINATGKTIRKIPLEDEDE
jgi:hypothetical protein